MIDANISPWQNFYIVNSYPIPANEKGRLQSLRNYDILDSASEHEFDRITELASIICETPISLVSLVDENRQWFKSSIGLDAKETPRELAFCGHTIMGTSVFEVADATKDVRFEDNALVTGNPNIRFYAGYPLIDNKGYSLGSLCVIDRKPKELTASQKRALTLLAEEVTALIMERRAKEELKNFEKLFQLSNDLVFIGGTDGFFRKINPAFTKLFGWAEDQLLNTSSNEFIHPDDLENSAKELKSLAKGNSTVNFTQRFKTSNGGYKTIQWTSTPEPSSGSIFGIGRDISELRLKEQQLAESEEKLRMFFEHSLGLMFTHDLKGNFLSVNNEGANVLGYSREELLKMNIGDILPDERKNSVTAYLDNIIKAGSSKGQTETKQRDGSVKIWMFNNILENNSGGEPYIIVNGMDITDRDQLEKRLRRTSQMLEQTNKVARVGGWEYDITNQKIFWTSVTKEIHGVAPGFEPELSSGINFYKEGDSRNRISAAIEKAIADGTPWDLELQIINARGEDTWVKAIGNADFEDGVCIRLYGTFQDIEDYKQGELALKRSIQTQERLNQALFEQIKLIKEQDKTIEKIQEFKFLADSIPQIVWTAKADGSFDYYNQYWFDYTGLSMENTLKHGWATVLHPEDVTADAIRWEESLTAGKPYQAEVRFERYDGIYKWHVSRAIPMKDDKGAVIKWFGSCTDIDEYKRALDLENKVSQFEDFNRIVAHNLRGPAGSIQLILEMFTDTQSEEEKAEFIQMLKQSSATLIETLNELMKVLEIRNNKEMAYDNCDLGKVVNGVKDMLRGQIVAKAAQINTDFEVETLQFPKMYLESIFYNMISNALKYSKKDVPPVIDIKSRISDSGIMLTFADNGLGIDLVKHGRNIFKLNNTFHTGFDSKGVGLFMTKTQIETFGGSITVKSQPNVGTTFTIIF